MSDIPDGTLIQMRTTRGFSHYMAGELIAVPIDAARELTAKRLAQPLHMMVPGVAKDADNAPLRQPAGVVRK